MLVEPALQTRASCWLDRKVTRTKKAIGLNTQEEDR